MALNTKKIRREVVIDGKKVWVTANTEQEYADKLVSLTRISTACSKQIKFEDFANEWYETFSKPNVAFSTAVNYKRQLDLHINPVIGSMNVASINSTHIQQVFNRMGNDKTLETKKKTKNVMNQIFKMAVEKGIITTNPLDSISLKIKGLPSTETEPYSVDEMRYMAAHLRDISNPTHRAWLALSISLPLRPEEVLGLRWSDIDLAHKELHVRNTVSHPTRSSPYFNSYTKTESSRRDLAISQVLIDLLPKKGKDTEFVIGGEKPISYTGLRHMRMRIAKEIGFRGVITPRRFRTTVATDISAMTHDLKLVQKMLGHATPQMTLKHYDKGRSLAADASDAIQECYGLS